ncbi:MAG: glycosyltransferase, partial [Candidatus Competibacteraceae bacterium]|nr:glycosyltransferase [Candidatus Competibacteraceae bacterium]
MNDKNDSSPRVDVIIPTYNYGCYLEECLTSVLNQTFKDYTVLIIDNASEDNTQQIANRWIKKDPRFTYVRNETNIGLIGSSRKSYALTQAKLILLLSADDLLEPLFLEKTVAALDRHPECSFAYSSWRFFLDNPAQENHGSEAHCFVPHNRSGCYDESKLLLSYNWITNSCCLFRREVCDSVGGPNPADVHHVGDWYIWMRLSAKGPAYYIHESLVRYRLHEACETSRLNDAGLSGFGHLYFHDKIFESDLWPWPVRLMAKANQIYWLTGEPLIDVARKMGRGNSNIAQFINKFRNEFLVEIARCVLHYNELKPNFLDTSENALKLLEEVLQQDPDNSEARTLIESFQEKQSSHCEKQNYSQWFNRHRWNQQSCQSLSDMRKNWQITPVINILVIANKNNDQLIRNTIQSLKEQTGDLWRLIVIVSDDFDDREFSDRSLITWIKSDLDQHAETLLASVDMDSNADWVMICEAGACFEPVFCNLVGEFINRHAEWRFIYTDEDVIDDLDHLSNPSLKPDSNTDLLRSSGYVGHACLIHSDLWRQISASERTNSNLLLNYTAALRCHEIFGEKAIGHIDEILFHHPLEMVDDLEKFEELGKPILQEHLYRQGIFSEVVTGLIKGSFFVDYPLSNTPLVSIIIPTKDCLDFLQPCIESLLEKTLYSNYEIIIVDNQSKNIETLDYLKKLEDYDQRIRVIPYPHAYNYSAINNLAAQQAKGDFLLFLNNDTVIVQENWLARLVSIGLRQDVGIVGCRLVYPNQTVQHAGVILGLSSVAGHIGIGLPMTNPGYMGRAQLMQNFSAVTAACMLIRKNLFSES